MDCDCEELEHQLLCHFLKYINEFDQGDLKTIDRIFDDSITGLKSIIKEIEYLSFSS